MDLVNAQPNRSDLAALVDHYPAYMAHHAGLPGSQFHDAPELMWIYTGLPVFNRVLRTRLSEGDADAAIESVLARFSAWSAPVNWQVTPLCTPPDLADRLLAHGLVKGPSRVGMVRDLDGADAADGSIPEDARIVEATDGEAFTNWSDVFVRCYAETESEAEAYRALLGAARGSWAGVMRCYLATVAGAPAAITLLFPHEGAAGVYWVGTDPAYRNRRLASALVRHATVEGRRSGCRLAILQATEEGAGLYARLGFRPAGRFEKFSWTP